MFMNRINVLNSCKTTLHGDNHPGPEVNSVRFSMHQPGHPSLQRRGKYRHHHRLAVGFNGEGLA